MLIDQDVRGAAHVNTAEGMFSLLKRGINGSFHHVSKGHACAPEHAPATGWTPVYAEAEAEEG